MPEEICVVVVGKTGVGKSSIINTLMREKVFVTASSSSSVTKHLQKITRMIGNNQRLVFVDTPGLFDTEVNDNMKTSETLVKVMEMVNPGPHIFILVLAIGRFTEEEYEAVKFLKNLFGKHVSNYLIIVFTKQDDLDNDKTDLKTYISKSNEQLKSIVRECQGYMTINNRASPQEVTESVNSILHKIKDVYETNKKQHYTGGMLEEAKEIFDEKCRKEEEAAKNRKLMEEKIQLLRRLKEKVKLIKQNVPNIIADRQDLLKLFQQDRVALEKLIKRVNICTNAAKAAGIVAPLLSISGSALCLLTLGASLGLSVAGTVLSGAVVSTDAALADKVFSKEKKDNVNVLLAKDARFVKDVEECCYDLKNLSDDLDILGITSESFISLPHDIHTVYADSMRKYTGDKYAITKELYDLENTIKNQFEVMEDLKLQFENTERSINSFIRELSSEFQNPI